RLRSCTAHPRSPRRKSRRSARKCPGLCGKDQSAQARIVPNCNAVSGRRLQKLSPGETQAQLGKGLAVGIPPGQARLLSATSSDFGYCFFDVLRPLLAACSTDQADPPELGGFLQSERMSAAC